MTEKIKASVIIIGQPLDYFNVVEIYNTKTKYQSSERCKIEEVDKNNIKVFVPIHTRVKKNYSLWFDGWGAIVSEVNPNNKKR